MKQKDKRTDWSGAVSLAPETAKVDAEYLNQAQEELENVVRASGVVFDEDNEYQVAQAITDHALGADYALESGTANNYVLAISGSRYLPNQLAVGYQIRFRTGNANTNTTPTANYGGLGVKTIVAENGTDAIAVGDIKVGVVNTLEYDGTNWRLILSKVNTASETVAGSIKISTSAQTLAGTDNGTAITPAKLFEKLSAAKEVTTIVSGSGNNATGYTRFYNIATGELIRKEVWGRANTLTSDNGRNIVFPLTFTTIYSVHISIVQNGGNTDASPDSPAHIRDLSLTSVRLCNADAFQTIDVWYSIQGR